MSRRLACSARGLTEAAVGVGLQWPQNFQLGNRKEKDMHGDADALTVDPRRLDVYEQVWLQKQHRKQLRAQGLTSRYQPHQGSREKARRVARLQRGS